MSVQFTNSTVEASVLPFDSEQRVTLVATAGAGASQDWKNGPAVRGFAFIDRRENPAGTLRRLLEDPDLDLARVVIDGVIDNRTFLDVLASMPSCSAVDVLWITDPETAYLSSAGRGGDRVLYALTPFDVRFYLEVNDLVADRRILGQRSRGL